MCEKKCNKKPHSVKNGAFRTNQKPKYEKNLVQYTN
jgi:hypothetical protein